MPGGLKIIIILCVNPSVPVFPVNTIFQKSIWGISPICNFDALGDKDEPIRLSGQKVKGQGHDQTKYGQEAIWDQLLAIEY